jgi:hypothetical protein
VITQHGIGKPQATANIHHLIDTIPAQPPIAAVNLTPCRVVSLALIWLRHISKR